MKCKLWIGSGILFLVIRAGFSQGTVRVFQEPLAPIAPIIFGEFLERAEEEEPGPEAAFDTVLSDFPENVYKLLLEMKIPLVRFYGGAWLEWGKTVWYDLIDIPGAGRRKAGCLYGYDEYFRTAKRLGWQTILPVALRKAVWKEIPLDSAAILAAGLVAYCNGTDSSSLPVGMPDWPAVRARNGHPEPFGVHYFQLGNEWASWMKDIGKNAKIPRTEEQIGWLKTCIQTMVFQMKKVDPSIEIIADAVIWSDLDLRFIEALISDENLQQYIDYYTVHSYRPWTLDRFSLGGKPLQASELSEEQKWYASVSVPELNSSGESVFINPGFDLIERYGRRACMTEWNWNGFGTTDTLLNSRYLKGMGAAGFMHALLRKSPSLCFATQSMLIGTVWELNAIRVYPGTTRPAIIFPTGQVMAFYNRYHGPLLLRSEVHGIPFYTQSVALGNIEPAARVAMLDIVVTGGDDQVFVHIINRSYNQTEPLRIILEGFPQARRWATQYILEGSLNNSDTGRMASVRSEDLRCGRKKSILVHLPSRCVSIVVFKSAAY